MQALRRNWFGFLALIPGLALIFLDQTILPVALPTIQKELGAPTVALRWSVNAYLLAIALLVLIAGKISDRIGHRKTLLLGISSFTLSSALCGLSQNIEMLILGRALQGIGAALIIPAQTALLYVIVPKEKRGKVMGLNVSLSSVFLMLGPLMGGYLTQMVSWRAIFWVNIPITLVGLLLIRLYLPAPPPTPTKIDAPGFIYFALSCASLIIALMQGQDWGWFSEPILGLLLLSLLSAIFLFRREKKSPHPFLDLGLFRHPIFAAINISISLVQFILMITVFRAIYFQQVLEYSPSQAGLLTFLSSAPVLFLSPLGGYLSDKVSPKLPIAIGYFCLITSFLGLGCFSTPPLSLLIVFLLLFGIGTPLIFTPSYSSAMGAIPVKKVGVAFGMVATLRNFTATFGLALIGSFLNAVETNQLRDHPLQEARIKAFSAANFMLAFLLLLAFAAVFVLYRRKSAHHLPETPAEGWD